MVESKSDFKHWIKNFGTRKLSEKLNIDQSTVRYWSSGKTIPNDKNKRKLIKLSNNKIRFGEIIGEHLTKKKTRKSK